MDKEINIAGKKIFYRLLGGGTPVMLVHGFGETGEVWTHQITSSSPAFEGRTCIIPDLPGSGHSEMIDDMSMEGMAEVLKKILDAEAVSTCIMIGHSMGGYVMLAFAEKYTRYLSAFALFHSTAFPDTEEKKATRRKGIEFIREHGAFGFLKTSTPNLFSPRTKETAPQLINGFIQSLENFSAEALVAYYESMIRRPDRTAVLIHSAVPVLFIMGEHDIAVPMDDGLKQCHLPAKASIHILHESGHMGMMEEPDKSNRLLNEFLQSVAP